MSARRDRAVRRARGLVVLALLCSAGTRAEGQLLGRMRRAVVERVAAPRDAAAAREAAAPRLEVTTARIDTFLVAMQPVIAYARATQAAREAQAAYERRKAQFEGCRDSTAQTMSRQPAAFTPAQQERVSQLAIRNTQLAAAAQAAAASGDMRAANAATDTMEVNGVLVQQMQYPALAACGTPAPRPVPPPAPVASQAELVKAPMGGMTGAQFGRLREMIAVFLLTGGREGNFSPTEQSAFGSRTRELAPLEPLFRSGALEWAQWQGMGSNWRAP